MSTVQTFFPKNRLVPALKAAEPRTVKEALERAENNLRQIAGECVDHVGKTLDALDAAMAAWPDKAEAESLAVIYDVSQCLIGVSTFAHLPELDRAATSLCDVIDSMVTSGRTRREPIDVHVSAMRLLSHDAPGVDRARILDGLLKVRTRFALQAASPEAGAS